MTINPISTSLPRKIKTIDSKRIIELYDSKYKIDVRNLFNSHQYVELFLCEDNGYKFFMPNSINGDSAFYAQLQKFSWYYMPWKWEHNIAYTLIDKSLKVLEIGCGEGFFLDKLKSDKSCNCTGLEFNEKAIEICKEKQLVVSNKSINEFAIENKESFDVVCIFQVLEHIHHVKPFIESACRCLKKNGLLIISVPNNDSFISLDDEDILNMPPHHVGHWNKQSLLSLQDILPIKICKEYFEPIQDYHKSWYNILIHNTTKKRISSIWGNKISIISKVFYKIYHTFYKLKYKHGHTILMVYTKL